MSTVPVKKRNSYADRYNGQSDPYAAFANESGPNIQGKLLTCRKGDWTIGQDATPVPNGAQFLFVVPETMRGWMKWESGAIVAADMGFVRDNFPVKHRYALGDMDESAWEKNPDGTPRSPWSRSYRALLIEVSPPHGDVTLSGSSYGLELALKEICSVYSTEASKHPDAFPVVELATKTRQHKTYGNIKGPWFMIVGWATVADIKGGRKKKTAATPAVKAEKSRSSAPPAADLTSAAAELDDALPDWGPTPD